MRQAARLPFLQGRSAAAGLVITYLVAALALLAQPSNKPLPRLDFGTALWPSHPTVLLARYRGGFTPVVAVKNGAPVISADGTQRTLAKSSELVTRLAADYAPANLTVIGGISAGTEHHTLIQGTPSADPIDSASAHGSLTFIPDRELPDCFLLVITFDTTSFQYPDADDHCRMTLMEIGTLHADETRIIPLKVQVIFNDPLYEGNRTGPVYTKPETAVFWQLYSRGREVKTTDLANVQIKNAVTVDGPFDRKPQANHGLGMFFYQHERTYHTQAVEAWERTNRHGNHPPEPYAQTPLVTGPAAALPHEASAILSVGADGVVSDVVLEAAFPPDAAQNLGACLRLWLFLPKIKDGAAVPTRIRIPLTF